MAIVSPLVFALGIADVTLTNQWFCTNLQQCTQLTNGIALTWAAVGIWASIPLFLNGLTAFWQANKPPGPHQGWLCLLSFLSTFVFAPAITVISALEASYKFPSMPVSVPPGAPPGASTALQAIFGIEVTLTVVGGVLFLHALGVLYLNCCCGSCIDEACCNPQGQYPDQYGAHEYQHHQGNNDLNHMNMWSAYRYGNKTGAAQPQLAFKSHVYSVGAQPGISGYSPSCSQGAQYQQHNRRW